MKEHIHSLNVQIIPGTNNSFITLRPWKRERRKNNELADNSPKRAKKSQQIASNALRAYPTPCRRLEGWLVALKSQLHPLNHRSQMLDIPAGVCRATEKQKTQDPLPRACRDGDRLRANQKCLHMGGSLSQHMSLCLHLEADA